MPANETSASPAGRSRRILVVDDDRDCAQALAEVLEAFGHTVSTVFDGREALNEALRTSPEIAILDLSLPSMDGFELAGRLRELPGLEHMKLIASSGYGSASDLRRSHEAGFTDHLVKPVGIEEVARAIGRLFQSYS